MVGRESEKTTALVLAFIMIAVSLLPIDSGVFAIYDGCPCINKFLYPFVHANVFHAAVNSWVMICAVFMYGTTNMSLVISYIIAISVPSMLVTSPTVGFSGVVYALLGLCSFLVARKLYYQEYMLVFLLLGFIMPNVSGMVHLYCYAFGTMISWLTSPRYE